MTPEERASLAVERVKGTASENLLEAENAKDRAVEHLFESSSVARELHVAGMLLRRGIGRVRVREARAFAKADDRFVRTGPNLITTREVLAEEAALLETVKTGQGKYEELGSGGRWKFMSPIVAASEEQTNAVLHVLKSRDLVTSIRGPAGSGKTTMMQEAVKAVAALSGKDVLVLAPSSSAVQVLKDQGFTTLDTFQKLMNSAPLQDVAQRKLLWIDEAGFRSTRQMRWAVDFAVQNDCRLVLSGDTRQHHGVERGDALRLMERAGVVAQAALTKIFRQQIAPLRDAVYDLSAGRTESGFDKLEACGAIQEIEDKIGRLEAIATRHVAAIKEGKSCLILAPTHAECRAIAGIVRDLGKKEGLLSPEEHTVIRLEKLNLTESQRRDAINYHLGQVIEFHRRARGGFKSGERWEVVQRSSERVVLVKDGEQRLLPLTQAKSFTVYTQQELVLAVGDLVRITKNLRAGARQFRNNELCTVTAIDRGSIKVSDGRVIKCSGPLHLDQGTAVTSHASQGKTVDQVIVSVPVAAFSQTNEAQFYVSMSRARHAIHLYTDSKTALKEAIVRPSERLSPLELLSASEIAWSAGGDPPGRDCVGRRMARERSERSEGIKRELAFVAEIQRALAAAKSSNSYRRNAAFMSTPRGPEQNNRERSRTIRFSISQTLNDSTVGAKLSSLTTNARKCGLSVSRFLCRQTTLFANLSAPC
ncbi:MAG: AAA family ATPase [Chthoniobacterales bacterium]